VSGPFAGPVTLGFTIGSQPMHKMLNPNAGTRHAFRACVETGAPHQPQHLLAFSSRDDPFNVFRGILFALPTSVLGFWLPLTILVTSRLRHG